MSNWRPWQYILLGTIIGLLMAGLLYLIAAQPRGTAVSLEPLPTLAPLTVHVAGEVQKPGIYQLPVGSRVNDAVLAAGGLAANADQSQINLAGIVRDGQQIFIPDVNGVTKASTVTASDRSGLLDLNKANKEELMTLPGIGATRAEDILQYRQDHSGFKTIDEIKNVKGIGETMFNQIKPFITVIP
jgi:competence protein ComEA